MRALLLAALVASGCGHGDAALREERSRARHYREAYESQVLEVARLKARVAELEQRCR